ncbi:MAG: sulfatase [Planctomycetota bacterium]
MSYRCLSITEFFISTAMLLGAGLDAEPTMATSRDRPNILLVLSDDQSAPHLGCYDNPDLKTPHLDRFAAEGMRFDRMYVASPQCVLARASIMTGQSPLKTRMMRFSAPLRKRHVTFPELLRAAGYFTGVVGRIHHLDGHNAIGSEVTRRVFAEHDLVTFPERVDFCRIADGGAGHIEQLVAFLDATPSDKPGFAQLSFDDPHRPLDEKAVDEPHDPQQLTLPPHLPDTRLVRDDFARYYDEIARLDADFGRVMDLLEKREQLDNTLVMFMGDNGGALLRGKGTLYERGLHVPMIIRWKGVASPGSTTAVLLSSEDIAPTFLDAAGLPPHDRMTGASFLPALRGEPFAGRERVFAARGTHGYNLPMHTADFDLSRCIRTRRHKLIYNPLWQLPFKPVDLFASPVWRDLEEMHLTGRLPALFSRLYFAPQRPIFELYDLQDDPYELDNLIAQPESAELEQRLKEDLCEWMIVEEDYVPLPIPDFNPFLKR